MTFFEFRCKFLYLVLKSILVPLHSRSQFWTSVNLVYKFFDDVEKKTLFLKKKFGLE